MLLPLLGTFGSLGRLAAFWDLRRATSSSEGLTSKCAELYRIRSLCKKGKAGQSCCEEQKVARRRSDNTDKAVVTQLSLAAKHFEHGRSSSHLQRQKADRQVSSASRPLSW